MDESISCSPTLDNNKSFQVQRQRRKCKRKGMYKEKQQQSNDHIYVQSPHPMDGFGHIDEELDNPRDQTFQVHSPSSTRKTEWQLHYEMFEDVFTLADQIDCEQAAKAHKQRKALKPSQGFQTASQSLTAALSEESCETNLLETEFGLTKTQLFEYCDRFDQNDPSQSSLTNVDTNSTSMSIVDRILHDFCSSPEYKADELMINDAMSAPPNFRFRGQIIKTYRRDKTQNVALEKHDQVDQQMKDEDDDRVSSCSSDLSMQEDLTKSTQLPTVVIGNIDLNSSQRLCQNLLNISAFFTANTEEGTIAPNNVKDSGNLKSAEITFESCSELTLKPPIESQTIAEEFTFDKKYSDAFNEDNSRSFDDYQWSSSHHSIQSPVKLKEPDFELEDKHISLFEIDPIYDSEKNCDNKTITEKLNSFDSLEKISICKSKNCDDHLTMDGSNSDVCKKEAKSDDWFNDDFDYDFNTEDILIKTKEDFLVSENHGTNKIDDIKAESVEERILLKDKQTSMKTEYIEEKPCTSRQAMQRINASTDDHENKLKGDEELNYELSQWLLDDIVKQKCDYELESTTKTVGFCTTRNQSIHVSDAAKRKVSSIVAELPVLPVKTIKDKRKSYPMASKEKLEDTSNEVGFDKLRAVEHNSDNIELSQWLLDDVTTHESNSQMKSSAVVSFCTIVAKLPELPVKSNSDHEETDSTISNEKIANTSYDHIELSQWLLDDVAKQKCDNGLEQPTVVGFCTAGNKSIQVSDAAKRKASTIVSELPELPVKSISDEQKSDPTIGKDMIENTAMDVVDSQIDKLQVDEEHNCDHIELSQWLLDDVAKQKCDNELEPSTVVGFCTAGNKSIQGSDAAKRKAASIVAELPELPVKDEDKIESSPNEVVDSKINEQQAYEENICDNIELSQWLLDDVGKQKCHNDLKPSTIVAFCTAGNKSIQISDAAKRKAASIVAKLPELPVKDEDKIESSPNEVVDSKINEQQAYEENICDSIELSQWLLDDVAKQKCHNDLKPSTIVAFCTAGNKSIQISDAAKRKAASIVAELPELPVKDEDKIEISPNEVVDSKINELQLIEENVCDNIELSEWLLDDVAKQMCDNELEPPTVVGFGKTGNKNINKNSKKQLKKEITNKRKLDEPLIETSVEKIKKNNELESEQLDDCNKIEMRKWSLDDATNLNSGNNLKTSNNIEIRKWSLDEAAYRNSGNNLKPPNFSKTSVYEKSKIDARINLIKWEVRSADFSSQKSNDVKDKQEPDGYSLQRRLSLLNDITKEKTDAPIKSSILSQLPHFTEKSIKELTNKRKLEETNIETSVEKIMKINNAEDEEALDSGNIELSKWLFNDVTDHITGSEFCSTPIVGYCAGNKRTQVTEADSKKTNKQSNEECENIPIVNNKMKLKDSFTETPVKTSLIMLNKSQTLEDFRTPQSSFQLSQTQSSLQELLARSPLEKYTKTSIISRKNLLTLNKKRKLGHSQNDDECIDAMENIMIDTNHTQDLEETCTPIKQKSLNQTEIYQTPLNSNVYMNSLSASSPQPLKSINGDKISCDLENDFQHIKWQPEEGELSKTLTNTSATKPSPKERIERLRIYGDPPALSPITTATISSLSAPTSRSFRTPGLRRRRILSKPK